VTTLGEAFIEVHADTKPFARELATQLKAILKSVDAKISPETVGIGQKIAQGVAHGVDKDSEKIRQSFRKTGNKIGEEGKSWVDKLLAPFDKMSKGNFILTRLFGQMIASAGRLTQRIGRLALSMGRAGKASVGLAAAFGAASIAGFKVLFGLAVDTTEVLGNFASAASAAGKAWLAFGSQIIGFLPGLIGAVVMIGLLVGAVVALAGVLVVILAPFAGLLNLALLLPAALSVLLTVILPLVLAFKGLGDAMSLVFEKDPKKFAEGLKKLSPTMQALVKTIRPFRTELERLQKTVQKAFFDPILQQLGPTLSEILSVLLVGFSNIASALGVGIQNLLAALASPEVTGALIEIMDMIATFLSNNSTVLAGLFTALTLAAQAALPMVLDLLQAFSDFLTKFGGWIEGAITDGRFEKWLQRGKDDLKAIWNLIQSLITLFGEMFAQTDEGGRSFLEKVTKTLDKITAWIKSPEGKKAMQDLVTLAGQFADALEIALKFVKLILGTYLAIAEAIKWINSHPIKKVTPGQALGGLGGVVLDRFSGGGVVPHDEMAVVHQGEPILDPANSVARNRSILAEAGMLDVLAGGQQPVVNVFVGNEQLDARTDYRIAQANRATARQLTTGPRS
jgi:hypothetical protein